LQDLKKYRELMAPVLTRYAIKRAAIFGSFAKGNQTSNSDFDLLIEPDKDFTLFKMVALQDELSGLINKKVDLAEFSAIKPAVRDEVLSSAILIL
jgi:predicted nucleotidyltransferase